MNKRSLFYLWMCILVFFTTVLAAEVSLRILPHFMKEPAKSILKESFRIPLSNTRTTAGTRIILPQLKDVDIAVVGDSFPFGTYVKDSDTFPAVLGDLMNLETVNLGVGSMAPIEYNRMVEVSAEYNPELIIYCIFLNDFLYTRDVYPDPLNKIDLENQKETSPLYTYGLTFREKIRMFRKKISNLFLSFQLVKIFQQPRFRLEQISEEVKGHYFLFATKKYWDPQANAQIERVQRAVKSNSRLIEAARNFSRELGAQFLVTLIPSKEMVYAPLSDSGDAIHNASFEETYKLLTAELNELEIPVYNALEDLRNAAREGRKLYFTVDGHFDESGHREMARLLRDYLSDPNRLNLKINK